MPFRRIPCKYRAQCPSLFWEKFSQFAHIAVMRFPRCLRPRKILTLPFEHHTCPRSPRELPPVFFVYISHLHFRGKLPQNAHTGRLPRSAGRPKKFCLSYYSSVRVIAASVKCPLHTSSTLLVPNCPYRLSAVSRVVYDPRKFYYSR